MPEGSQAPQIYLVGEAPGRQQAEAGRPFVGPAGTALRDMIREAGMEDAQVRLSNALPFRPIERSAKRGLRNRRPTEKELRDYGPIVLADITSVRPKIIIALGNAAASLFGASKTIENARKQVLCFQDMPVRITYHPGSCCASAEEDRSCGEQQFVICVPIGNEGDPILLSLLEEASGES